MERRILSLLTEGLPAARRALELLAVVAAGLLVARLIWLVIEPGGTVTKPIAFASSVSASPIGSGPVQLDLMILTRTNHFGATVADSPIMPTAPETSLNLRLKGVRAISESAQSDDMANSSIAIIQTPDQAALTYRTGDTIIDGVTLDRILPDRVLIMKGGSLETLMMESGSGALSVLLLPGEQAPEAAQSRPSQLTSVSSASTGNIFSYMDLQPIQSGGGVTGYRVQSRGNEANLAAMGLQSGDVIVEIAGNRIANIDNQNLIAQLGSATEIDLTVERGGTLQSVSLSIPGGD